MEHLLQIGLTYTGTEEKHNNYVNWLKGTDEIKIVRLSAEEYNSDVVNDLDGIVLSGGLDMHPKYYAGEINYANAPAEFNEQRDEFEQAIFKKALKYNKPVLGVCRGMQLVNCSLGGTLVQDLGTDTNMIHRFDETDKLHETIVTPGSLLSSITGQEKVITNSAHHQAVDKAGEGLRINARSLDGVVEGIEWTDPVNKPFFLGVQWHPERMFKAGLTHSPATSNIRDRFIEEVKKSANT